MANPGLAGQSLLCKAKAAAQAALGKVLEYECTGIVIDDKQTVAGYLTEWLCTKALTLKPTTMANYQAYVHRT